MNMNKTESEKLASKKDDAYREYDKLNIPAAAAYKKYEAACAAYKEAVMYEKAKRQVMRDLINAAAAGKVA